MVHEHVAVACSSRKRSGRLVPSGPPSTVCVWGTHASSLSSGRSTAYRAQSPARSSGPSTTVTSRSDSSSSRQSTLEHFPAHLGVDLEPDDAAELVAAPQHRLDRLEEVFGFVLELEVGVARDAEHWWSRISIPGKSASSFAAMTCSRGTKRSPSGSTMKRGSSGGTFTRAKRSSPVTPSRTVTARLSDRLEMYGNGCAGRRRAA